MTEVKQTKKISPRRRARECTIQVLYSWLISKNSPERIELDFITNEETKGIDLPYFRKLFRQTIENVDRLDTIMQPYLDRQLQELDPIEYAILLMAVYELQFEPDVPYKVVINEAIEVAKSFGAEESHKYINGVLDKIAPIIRH